MKGSGGRRDKRGVGRMRNSIKARTTKRAQGGVFRVSRRKIEVYMVDSWARVAGVKLRKRSHSQCHLFIFVWCRCSNLNFTQI